MSLSTATHDKRLNWRNILWLLGSAAIALIFVPLALWQWGITLPAFAVFFLGLLLGPLCITAGYHRLFSHRSYEAGALVKLFYLIVGAANFQGSALEWCSDHRRHHYEVDTENDPYNIRRGFFYAHMGWLFHHQVQPERFPVDLTSDPLVRWQHRYYVLLAIGMGMLLPWLVGAWMGNAWGGLIYGGFLRVVLGQHSTFLINSLSHTLGTRPFSLNNSARDNIVMAFLAYGEGYHNFHHRFQTDYRNGYRWYHWDPTKWLIRLFSFFGLTHNLKRVSGPLIETTRMQTAQRLLEARGIPTDRLSVFWNRALKAQARLRALYCEHRNDKKIRRETPATRRLELHTELKLARIEFRAACRQWAAYARAIRVTQPQSI